MDPFKKLASKEETRTERKKETTFGETGDIERLGEMMFKMNTKER